MTHEYQRYRSINDTGVSTTQEYQRHWSISTKCYFIYPGSSSPDTIAIMSYVAPRSVCSTKRSCGNDLTRFNNTAI